MAVDQREKKTAGFRKIQGDFAAHLRAPDKVEAPAGIEDRRMGIYRDLIYNNIESFIAGGFPVLRSILDDDHWHAMVRDFVRTHHAHSPYFLQISEEFLQYLQAERAASEDSSGDPAFLRELAHYEWVELALDVSEGVFPAGLELDYTDAQLLDWAPIASPLAWNLSYEFPVHHIGPAFQPAEPPQTPTFLVVYRNRADDVGFLEANAVTSHLLSLIQSHNATGDEAAEPELRTGRALLEALAADIQHPQPAQVVDFGKELLRKLHALDILAGFRPV
ncbi:DUF2063 domain-containing protein [Microbulbifer sp. Q7]|uniref:HvfC family RiPP maturation protein n=1 Tax=Microbulbifer sp. Q7 TaxID=1785091 RepID=UPI0008360F34|nr:putative DNA-binding domain-containing protein [Microbulbifer sp. Q7]